MVFCKDGVINPSVHHDDNHWIFLSKLVYVQTAGICLEHFSVVPEKERERTAYSEHGNVGVFINISRRELAVKLQHNDFMAVSGRRTFAIMNDGFSYILCYLPRPDSTPPCGTST